ncbi:hypothetical protein GNI_134340 [Gregarina niphandrodes]|uniref:Transmembrane protein n=1 Tax=Gregarina niphandrodes TaxID=110365 RepID=A0A023B107_GRENI|nr:hypothetical protein GNI_134340 [Gregarina niphandrodes]EZG46260.1 hypothetical protein GNI_134340 [Gregarina niphandrodes]|eukprot:XP_011132330.1 hypothetical protein GNI_134340 [Gregarina niphandrodes]
MRRLLCSVLITLSLAGQDGGVPNGVQQDRAQQDRVQQDSLHYIDTLIGRKVWDWISEIGFSDGGDTSSGLKLAPWSPLTVEEFPTTIRNEVDSDYLSEVNEKVESIIDSIKSEPLPVAPLPAAPWPTAPWLAIEQLLRDVVAPPFPPASARRLKVYAKLLMTRMLEDAGSILAPGKMEVAAKRVGVSVATAVGQIHAPVDLFAWANETQVQTVASPDDEDINNLWNKQLQPFLNGLYELDESDRITAVIDYLLQPQKLPIEDLLIKDYKRMVSVRAAEQAESGESSSGETLTRNTVTLKAAASSDDRARERPTSGTPATGLVASQTRLQALMPVTSPVGTQGVELDTGESRVLAKEDVSESERGGSWRPRALELRAAKTGPAAGGEHVESLSLSSTESWSTSAPLSTKVSSSAISSITLAHMDTGAMQVDGIIKPIGAFDPATIKVATGEQVDTGGRLSVMLRDVFQSSAVAKAAAGVEAEVGSRRVRYNWDTTRLVRATLSTKATGNRRPASGSFNAQLSVAGLGVPVGFMGEMASHPLFEQLIQSTNMYGTWPDGVGRPFCLGHTDLEWEDAGNHQELQLALAEGPLDPFTPIALWSAIRSIAASTQIHQLLFAPGESQPVFTDYKDERTDQYTNAVRQATADDQEYEGDQENGEDQNGTGMPADDAYYTGRRCRDTSLVISRQELEDAVKQVGSRLSHITLVTVYCKQPEKWEQMVKGIGIPLQVISDYNGVDIWYSADGNRE